MTSAGHVETGRRGGRTRGQTCGRSRAGAWRGVGAGAGGIRRPHHVIIRRAVDGGGVEISGIDGSAAADRAGHAVGDSNVAAAGNGRAQKVVAGRTGSHRPANQHAVVAGISRDTCGRRRHITGQFQPEVIIHGVIGEVTALAHVDRNGVLSGVQQAAGKSKSLVGEGAIDAFADGRVAGTIPREITS